MTASPASPGVKEDPAPEGAPMETPLLDRNHQLILWNDDVSPVTLVINVLINLLGFPPMQAVETVKSIEKVGKGMVYSGTLEVCELRHEQFADFKLTTTIESR